MLSAAALRPYLLRLGSANQARVVGKLRHLNINCSLSGSIFGERERGIRALLYMYGSRRDREARNACADGTNAHIDFSKRCIEKKDRECGTDELELLPTDCLPACLLFTDV